MQLSPEGCNPLGRLGLSWLRHPLPDGGVGCFCCHQRHRFCLLQGCDLKAWAARCTAGLPGWQCFCGRGVCGGCAGKRAASRKLPGGRGRALRRSMPAEGPCTAASWQGSCARASASLPLPLLPPGASRNRLAHSPAQRCCRRQWWWVSAVKLCSTGPSHNSQDGV